MSTDINIRIIDRHGVEHIVSGPTDMGLNIMELCRMYELPVKGECGGMAMCATCQVYIESEHDLGPVSDAEMNMLDQAFHVKENSRLGCQIRLQPSLEGLTVRIAPESE